MYCSPAEQKEPWRVPGPVSSPIEREMFVECFSYRVAAMIYRESLRGILPTTNSFFHFDFF